MKNWKYFSLSMIRSSLVRMTHIGVFEYKLMMKLWCSFTSGSLLVVITLTNFLSFERRPRVRFELTHSLPNKL